MKKRLAAMLRKYADRIDRAGAPKATHWTFTFENREGIRFRENGHGCRLWYLGDADYEKAHDEADNPPVRVDWKALAARKPPYIKESPRATAKSELPHAPRPGRPYESPAPRAAMRVREKGGYSPAPRVYDLDNLPNAPAGPALGSPTATVPESTREAARFLTAIRGPKRMSQQAIETTARELADSITGSREDRDLLQRILIQGTEE